MTRFRNRCGSIIMYYSLYNVNSSDKYIRTSTQGVAPQTRCMIALVRRARVLEGR